MSKTNTLLIVDDEEIGRQTLEALLYADNYQLEFASSGLEALEMVKKTPPDLILLDIMMPGMDGLQICQHLKADARWQHIPIILTTALDSKSDLARGFEAGADDFVTKPINMLELRARVRSLLRIKVQFDELQAMLQLRENLANMIVHDMRSPLTAILGVSELLKKADISPDSVADLDILHRQVLRLHTFVNDLLTMAKMKSGSLMLNLAQVDVKQLILNIEGGYNVIARSKDIKFVLDLPEEVYEIFVDVNLFQRVLDNLLSNAIKFSKPGGTVTLKFKYVKQNNNSMGIEVQVIDEGIGITEEKRKLLFDRLEAELVSTEEPSENIFSQFGFGLAFCKMVIEAHGGRIYATANKPAGAILTVEI